MIKEKAILGGGNLLKGWKIKLNYHDNSPEYDDIGFDDSFLYPNSYCIPLTEDTPKIEEYSIAKYSVPPNNIAGDHIDSRFYYYQTVNGYYGSIAEKGIVYRLDKPENIQPASKLIKSFYPLLKDDDKSLDDIVQTEYIIVYDPDREWKPKNKLTINYVYDPTTYNDNSLRVGSYSWETQLPLYSTLNYSDTGYEYGNTYEFALIDDHFMLGFYMECGTSNLVNCERMHYASQNGAFFRVLDPNKDVSLTVVTVDPSR